MDSKKIFRTFDVNMALLRYRDNLMQGICGMIRNFWKFVLVSGWKVFIFELSKIRYCMERLSFGTTPHVSTSDLYKSCPTRKDKPSRLGQLATAKKLLPCLGAPR